MHCVLAMSSKHTIFLLGSTLLAGIVAALAAIAIVTGPAMGEEMRTVRSEAETCSEATWPRIPAECLTRVVNGKPAPDAPVRAFTYAREIR